MICILIFSESLIFVLSLSQSYLKRFMWHSLTIFVVAIRSPWGGMNKKDLEIQC